MLSAWLGRLRTRAQSLRVTITLSFILLVMLTAGSIGYITLQNSQRGHEVLGDQFLHQLELNVRQRLDDYLAMPHMINRYNVEEIKRDPTVLADLTTLRPRYLKQLLAFDPIMAVAIGIERSGEFIGVGRRSNDTYDSGVMDRRVDNTYRVYLLDRSGNIQGIVAETPNYDARTRPWYQAGVKAGKASWSPVYVWASQKNIGITAVLPIYDDAGVLLGVHQSALSLEYIGRFLSTLQIGRSGQIFLMERSGWLIGTSTQEEPVRLDPSGANLARIKATESTDAFTRAAAEHLMARFPGLQDMPDPYRTHVDLAGKSYFLIASPFSDPYGLDWVMVIGVPETDFMAEVTANRRMALLLSGAALLVAIAIGVSTAHWITEPIRRLNIAFKELGRGHWKQAPITNRRDEIGALAREFSAMAAALTEKEEQLRAYADVLEQRVAERTAALQESQRQLAALLNNLPGMAYRGLADPRRTMHYLSEGCLNLTGYTDAELTGNHSLSFADLIVEEDRQRVWDEIQDAITRRASYVIEYRIRTRNGDLRWVWEKGSGVFDDSNTLVALEGFISDITDRKQAELALQQALEELKRSNTDLERFAYVASHDLQEPLRTVSGFVQLLGERYRGQLDADADEFIRFAIDGVKRMQTLINDLLEYSRVNTRQAPLQPTDANMALDIALWNLGQAIAEAEASVTHTPLPIVLADAIQLVQLFQNLIGNAIKFRGTEPPQIHISARQISQADEATAATTMWEFAVRDNGIGIAPEDHKRIFGLFQRAHSQQQYPGSGIGLAVCQRIVERHGGRIWVESQPGQGTTFFFTLPAAEQTAHV